MKLVSIALRLRPVRFGFLVRPNDATNLQRVFEINTSIWGGMFNPIFPYFERLPKWWDRSPLRIYSARELVQGYLEFFEPDFVVQTEEGQAAKLQLPKEVTLDLDDVLRPKPENMWKGHGLNVVELYKYLYHKEFKFVHRHEPRIAKIIPREREFRLFTSCVFGAFPREKDLEHIEKAFITAFTPEQVMLDGERLASLYETPALSPLEIGKGDIRVSYSSLSLPTLFLLDPSQPRDMIDFWNLRAIQPNVWAIPVQWIELLSKFCTKFLAGSDSSLATGPSEPIPRLIQISRSIPSTDADDLFKRYVPGPRQVHVGVRQWYPHFRTEPSSSTRVEQRPVLTSRTATVNPDVFEDEDFVELYPLSPEFADEQINYCRWANVVKLRDLTLGSEIATVFPNNLRNPSYPRPGFLGVTRTNREGSVFFPKSIEIKEHWKPMDGTSAFIDWLKTQNVRAEISSAGRTTLQMIRTLHGLGRLRVVAHPEIVQLLHKMAHKSVPSGKGGIARKEYPGRTFGFKRLQGLLHKINKSYRTPVFSLEKLTKYNVLRIGLEVQCSHCESRNWYPVDSLDYALVCENCLKKFDFPSDNPSTSPWCYRVIGPFSRPDYAQGAYASALAIRFFSEFSGIWNTSLTWSTGLDLKFPSSSTTEVDFLLWYQRQLILDEAHEVDLVFGEAKSFAEESFKSEDVQRLKRLAILFPGSVLVFAAMKQQLSAKEKKIISSLALWGRKYTASGRLRAAVVVLTATELFSLDRLSREWERKGGRHARLIRPPYVDVRNLCELADLTQQLYLGLPSIGEWYRKKLERKVERRSRVRQK